MCRTCIPAQYWLTCIKAKLSINKLHIVAAWSTVHCCGCFFTWLEVIQQLLLSPFLESSQQCYRISTEARGQVLWLCRFGQQQIIFQQPRQCWFENHWSCRKTNTSFKSQENQRKCTDCGKKMDLLACLLSGNHSKERDFLQKQPIFLCQHSDLKQGRNTDVMLKDGKIIVVQEKSIRLVQA